MTFAFTSCSIWLWRDVIIQTWKWSTSPHGWKLYTKLRVVSISGERHRKRRKYSRDAEDTRGERSSRPYPPGLARVFSRPRPSLESALTRNTKVITGACFAMNQAVFLAITLNLPNLRIRDANGLLLIGWKTGARVKRQSPNLVNAITWLLLTLIWKPLYSPCWALTGGDGALGLIYGSYCRYLLGCKHALQLIE